MAAMSDFLENSLIDFLFGRAAFTPPANFHVALLTSAPSDAGGGIEVAGGSYARVAVAAGAANWNNTQGNTTGASTGTGGTTANAAAVNFPSPTAGWGTATHFAVYDAAVGGNLLFYAPLAVAKVINQGDVVSFAAGALTFQIDN